MSHAELLEQAISAWQEGRPLEPHIDEMIEAGHPFAPVFSRIHTPTQRFGRPTFHMAGSIGRIDSELHKPTHVYLGEMRSNRQGYPGKEGFPALRLARFNVKGRNEQESVVPLRKTEWAALHKYLHGTDAEPLSTHEAEPPVHMSRYEPLHGYWLTDKGEEIPVPVGSGHHAIAEAHPDLQDVPTSPTLEKQFRPPTAKAMGQNWLRIIFDRESPNGGIEPKVHAVGTAKAHAKNRRTAKDIAAVRGWKLKNYVVDAEPEQLAATKSILLHHFSPYLTDDEATVDPDEAAERRQKYSRAEFRESQVRRNFWYLNPKDQEGQIYGTHYTAEMPEEKIYDLHKDHEGHTRSAEGKGISWLFNKLIESGYYGAKYNTGGRDLVTTFVPIKAKRVQPEQLAKGDNLHDIYPYGGWIHPEGHIIGNRYEGGHDDSAAKERLDDLEVGPYSAALKAGYVHVAFYGHEVHAHGHIRALEKHREVLKDVARGLDRDGYGKVVYRPLRTDDPEQLARRERNYLHDLAKSYHEANKDRFGLDLPFEGPETPFSKDLAERTASAFAQAKHQPNHPVIKKAYDQLKAEALAQYQHLKKAGMKFEPHVGDTDYQTHEEMLDDVLANKRHRYYPTTTGFGGGDPFKDHPLYGDVPGMKGTKYNDLFRSVHDLFGHGVGEHSFKQTGEFKAYQNHARMFSPLARLALISETHGQNSWLHSPLHGKGDRYADQKATVLPKSAHPQIQLAATRPQWTRVRGQHFGQFTTSNGHEYTFSSTESPPGHHGVAFAINDHPGPDPFGKTGTGNAKEVFSHAIAHVHSLIHDHGAKSIHFTAEASEPSRVKFYDWLAARAHKLHPDFVGLKGDDGAGNPSYKLVHKDYLAEYKEKLKGWGVPEPEQLARWRAISRDGNNHEARFDTPGGKYIADAWSNGNGRHEISFQSIDPEHQHDSAGVLGTGHAKAVMENMIALTHDYLHTHTPGIVSFTGAEPSRRKLYKWLAARVHKIHPDYTGHVEEDLDDTHPLSYAEFHLVHKDYPKPKGAVQLAKWEPAFEGSSNLQAGFDTPGGKYTATAKGFFGPQNRIGNEAMKNLSFGMIDPEHDGKHYGVTGVGHGKAVFGHMIELVHDLLHQHQPPVVTFTADTEEPTREKLYKSMVSKVHKVHPHYTGHMIAGNKHTHFYLVHRDHLPEFHEKIGGAREGVRQLAREWEEHDDGDENSGVTHKARFTADGIEHEAQVGVDDDGEHFFGVRAAVSNPSPEFLKESARLLLKHLDAHDPPRVNIYGMGRHAIPLAQIVNRMRPYVYTGRVRDDHLQKGVHVQWPDLEDYGTRGLTKDVTPPIEEKEGPVSQALAGLARGDIIAPAVDKMEEDGLTDHPLYPVLKRLHDGKGLDKSVTKWGIRNGLTKSVNHPHGQASMTLDKFHVNGKKVPGVRLHPAGPGSSMSHFVPLRKEEFSKLSDYLHGVEQDPHGTEEPQPEQLSAVADATSAQGDERKKLLLRLLLEAKLKPIAAGNSYTIHPAGMNAGQYAEVYHNGEPEAVDYVGHYYGLLAGQNSHDLHAFHEGDGNHTLTVFDSPLPTDHLYEALAPAVGSPMVRVLPKDGFSRVAVVNLPQDSGILKASNAANVQQFNGNFATLRHRSSPGSSASARETHRNAIRTYERQAGTADPQG